MTFLVIQWRDWIFPPHKNTHLTVFKHSNIAGDSNHPLATVVDLASRSRQTSILHQVTTFSFSLSYCTLHVEKNEYFCVTLQGKNYYGQFLCPFLVWENCNVMFAICLNLCNTLQFVRIFKTLFFRKKHGSILSKCRASSQKNDLCHCQ